MKFSIRFLIFAIMTATLSNCQSQSINPQVPMSVSSKSCASSNGPLPSLSDSQTPSGLQFTTPSLGGGIAQSKEFTIELLLYCDPNFQLDAADMKYHSDVSGLAIYSNWRFDAPIQNEKTFSYFGLEPNIQLQLVSYNQGYVAEGQLTGLQISDDTKLDLSKKSSLRFVYIAEGPFGQFAGAALSFDLPPVPNGIQPENLLVTALSNSELQSIKSVLPTLVP